MSDIENKIKEEARKVLESGDVSVVLGWGTGSVPFKTTPEFIEKAEDADRLVWNPACVNNLAVYLPRIPKDRKVGIVARPYSTSVCWNAEPKKRPRKMLIGRWLPSRARSTSATRSGLSGRSRS